MTAERPVGPQRLTDQDPWKTGTPKSPTAGGERQEGESAHGQGGSRKGLSGATSYLSRDKSGTGSRKSVWKG